jgi:hypothetical protein
MFPKIRLSTTFVIAVAAAMVSCASSEPKSDLDIAVDSDEIRVALSKEVARGLVEDFIGSSLSCTSEVDGGFGALLQKLDREGPRSHATYRDGENTITGRRRGGRLDLDFSGGGSGRIEATMPWAIAECLLGNATTVDKTTKSAVRVKVVNPDGRNFSFKLD